MLTESQQKAVDLSLAGHSFFLTGKSGTGKTFAVENIFDALTCKKHNVKVTCSTGIACSNFPSHVGATTLHSFAGIRDGRGSRQVLLQLVKANEAASRRWREVQTLVVDEISMLSKHIFDTLEFIARSIRENDVLFGGIQIIVSGDFSQLPPVFTKYSTNVASQLYAFESRFWDEVLPHTIELDVVMRQNDLEFINFLNDVRVCNIGETQQEYAERYLTSKDIDPVKFGVEFIPELFCSVE